MYYLEFSIWYCSYYTCKFEILHYFKLPIINISLKISMRNAMINQSGYWRLVYSLSCNWSFFKSESILYCFKGLRGLKSLNKLPKQMSVVISFIYIFIFFAIWQTSFDVISFWYLIMFTNVVLNVFWKIFIMFFFNNL